jgi:hypothetical protein
MAGLPCHSDFLSSHAKRNYRRGKFLVSISLQRFSITLQLLDILLSTLNTLKELDFTETANCIPQPYTTHQDIDPSILSPYHLPLVLVPPEVIEFDSMSAESGEESQIKKEEWPEFFIRLFPNDVGSGCLPP